MKNIIRKLAVVAAIVLCLAQTCQVFATENSNVTLKNQGINMKQRTIQVQCDISGADPITNGKIRILYNSSQLHLKANEKGELVTNALCEVNDCISGNKEEGEIVLAFASAEELPAQGCLTTMTFELDGNVKTGDVIKIMTNVEKLAGNSGNVSVEKKDLSVTVPEKEEKTGSGQEEKKEENSGDASETVTKKEDDKISGQIENTSAKNSSSGQSGSKKQSSSEGKTNAVKSVKTGATVNVLWPAAMVTVSGAVIIGIIRKRKTCR